MFNPFFQSLISDFEHAVEPIQAELDMKFPAMQNLPYAAFEQANIQVELLRLDTVHSVVSGNKWYKLKYNLVQALNENARTLITFGGAWSNHLHAFAYVGQKLGLKTVIVLRGTEWENQSNPMLDDLKSWGAQIHYVSREQYRLRHQAYYQKALLAQYPQSYLIPEGGDNFFGLLGMASVFLGLSGANQQYLNAMDSVALGCGTGNSMTGIRLALPNRQRVMGFSALKGDWFAGMIQQKLAQFWPMRLRNWEVFSQFHGGGFGKLTSDMKTFVADFEASTKVLLDPIYTAKLLVGVTQLANDGYFPSGHRLLLIHTGGLQGRRSLLLKS